MPTSSPASTTPGPDARQYAPAAERNQWPILEVLKRVLPAEGKLLEVAAGTGQHAAFFSHHLPALTWQPSDFDPANLPSIQAWGDFEGSDNWLPPLHLDVAQPDWGVDALDAILCINMIHISPWSASEALFQGAGQRLSTGGVVVTYGPYLVEGVPTVASNERFDQWLKDRDPRWGIRQLGDIEALANANGLQLRETISMPANNLIVVFHKE